MKVSFPLSLKITLWLLLNFVLLGVAAGVALTLQGGLSWSALVRGPAGNKLVPLAQSVIAELTAAAPEDRATVLAPFVADYGVPIYVFDNEVRQLAGEPVTLPQSLSDRLFSLGPPPPRPGPRDGETRPGREPGPRDANRSGTVQERGLPPGGGPGTPGGPSGDIRARFVERTLEPDVYWLGIHARFYGGGRPTPVTVIMGVTSHWAMIKLLGLQVWLLAAGSVVALSVLFWLPLVHSMTGALKRLTVATEQIAEGRFETRVATGRRDELGRLGESVNSMAERLDTLVRGQKRFLGDVAHELGSPLGRLQVAIEVLESRADPSLQGQILDVREEVQQMTTLVNELLAFTKAGLRARPAELSRVELYPLVNDLIAREAADARITVSIAPEITVRADAPMLARALSNLVRNAVRYAGDAGTIVILARKEADRVHIEVQDEGPGVPPEALARLGEPFYRPEAARTRETGGVGLGLAIVRSALAACGGEIRFSNRLPHGLRVEIVLAAA